MARVQKASYTDMNDREWVDSILKVDGNKLKTWMEKHAPKTGATPTQIAKLVGITGPERKSK